MKRFLSKLGKRPLDAHCLSSCPPFFEICKPNLQTTYAKLFVNISDQFGSIIPKTILEHSEGMHRFLILRIENFLRRTTTFPLIIFLSKQSFLIKGT